MKNRNKLRHIIINNKEYLWNYYYDDMDFSNFPYSYYLFVPINNRKLKVSVYFKKYMPQMNLDVYTSEGTPCLYKNKPVVLNLCRPFYGGACNKYLHMCMLLEIIDRPKKAREVKDYIQHFAF